MVDENYGVSIVDVLEYYKLQGLKPPHPALQLDDRLLNKALWDLGLDTSLGFNEHSRPHRSLKGTTEDCLCFRGMERTDSKWLQSGYSTFEAVKGSSKDPAMQRELERLRNKG